MTLNLDALPNVNQTQMSDIEPIQAFALDHGMSGFVLNQKMHLHNPRLYLKLVDNHKQRGQSQCLISDLFRIKSFCI